MACFYFTPDQVKVSMRAGGSFWTYWRSNLVSPEN